MLLLLTQLQKILQLDHKTNITQDHQKIGNLTTKKDLTTKPSFISNLNGYKEATFVQTGR